VAEEQNTELVDAVDDVVVGQDVPSRSRLPLAPAISSAKVRRHRTVIGVVAGRPIGHLASLPARTEKERAYVLVLFTTVAGAPSFSYLHPRPKNMEGNALTCEPCHPVVMNRSDERMLRRVLGGYYAAHLSTT
jgi:hypothetical protein